MSPAGIDPKQITGLVLAGGRGSRMGGVEKGLQDYRGQPLALHALQRLAPQVGRLLISANRHLERYQTMGVPVCPDLLPDHPGPLAGILAGLARCETPFLASVPCDSPLFPPDLVERLGQALLEADAEIAMAATREQGVLRAQPVFCLMRAGLADSLARFLEGGQRKVERWAAQHRRVELQFEEADAFFNANTLAELQQLRDS